MTRTTTRRRRLMDTVATINGGETMEVEHITNQPIDMPTETADEIAEGARRAIAAVETNKAGVETATQDLVHWIMLRDDMVRANSDAPDKLYKLAWTVGKNRKEMTDEQKMIDSQRSSYQEALIKSIIGEMPKQPKEGKDQAITVAQEKYADDRKVIMDAFDLTRQFATLGIWHQHFNRELSVFELPRNAFLRENTRTERFVMADAPDTIPLLLPGAAEAAGYMRSHLIAWKDGTRNMSITVQASLSRVRDLATDRISPKAPVNNSRAPGGETNQQTPAGNSAANEPTKAPSTELTITQQQAELDKLDPYAEVTDPMKKYLLGLVAQNLTSLLKASAHKAVAEASGSEIPFGEPRDRLNNLQDVHILIGRWINNLQEEMAANKKRNAA